MRSIDGLLGHNDLVEREQGLIKAGYVSFPFSPGPRTVLSLTLARSCMHAVRTRAT